MKAGLTVSELIGMLESGACTAEELTLECLERIARLEPTVGAFLTVDARGALAAAAESDRRRHAGALLHPMDGIPFAVKDNFCTRGLRTTCGSRMLENYLPPYDAEVVSLLRGAGCVLLGKLNMDEFSMGSSTRYSALGVTRNPLDPARVPGGSSGGAAAAVAAGEVPFAIGSDTGGSVRQPAAFCGVTGLKPTAGRISRFGMTAFAPSLDCVGIVAHTAADAELVFHLLAGRPGDGDGASRTSMNGRRENDPGTLCAPAGGCSGDTPSIFDIPTVRYPGDGSASFRAPVRGQETAVPDASVFAPRSAAAGVRGLRIAVAADGGVGRVAPCVAHAVAQAAECLGQAGAVILPAELPSPEQALLCYCVLTAVEAASDLARYDGIRYGGGQGAEPRDPAALRGACFGAEVKRRILLGTALMSGDFRARYYEPACRVRESVRHMMGRMLAQCDLILCPTVTGGAFRFDETVSELQMREMDLCTVYASLAGVPAISVPVGEDENRMPLGIQLMAAPLREDLVFRAAAALEAAAGPAVAYG